MRKSAFARKPRNNIKTKSFAFKGGLNLVDPPIKIPDGMIIAGINYEPLSRDGYRRIAGIERSDGQPRPSDASYWILNYDNKVLDQNFTEGDVVVGANSSHTADILSVWEPTCGLDQTTRRETNGDFTADISGWTDSSDAGGSIAWNALGYLDLIDTTGAARADQSFTTVAGRKYRLVVDKVALSTQVNIGTTQGGSDLYLGANDANDVDATFIATGTTTWIRMGHAGTGTTAQINLVSITEYCALNLLSHPENFGHADWSVSSASITINNVVAYDGSLSADTLTGNGVGLYSKIQQGSIPVTQGTTKIAVSQLVKDLGNGEITLYLGNATTVENISVKFTFTNGVPDNGSKIAGGITLDSSQAIDKDNGWYEATILVTFTTAFGASDSFIYAPHLKWNATTLDSMALGGSQLTETAELQNYVPESSVYLVLGRATGVFQDDEPLQVSATTIALANGQARIRDALTVADDSIYIQDAIETQRAKILKPGDADGSGPVRGVHVYNNEVYAFRDNAAVTQCLMWKQTVAGWVQQSLGNRVAFTAGTAEFLEGETLTQTGTTSIINRVVKQSGDWGTNDAAGYLIIGTVTSGPYAAGIATSPSGSATLSGAEVANTIQPGGHYEFENYNFFGAAGSFRMYGVNGVDYAFEWDGTVFVPIITGNTNDKPTHLAINEYHLALTFEKGSLQMSGTGLPYVWSGSGATEIGTGDQLIGLKKEVGSALVVLCRNRTFALFGKGTTESPWDLRNVSDESGGIEWSLQRMSATWFLDDRGFTEVAAVQEYGDFASSVYSQVIEPLLEARKDDIVASIIVKSKSQIRLFFNDGVGIFITFNGKKVVGFAQFRYLDASDAGIVAYCTTNGEDASGKEILFMGSENGYVYQLDYGTSFDGAAISASLVLSYSHLGSPSQDKQFKKVLLEVEGPSGTGLEYSVLLDYSSGRSPSGITLTEQLASGGVLWNAANWNEFNWATEDISKIEGNIDGVGRNISLQLQSTATYVEPHTLYSATFHYIPRKLVR